MANKYRGEIAANLDGTPYTLCLTLGALAELETAFDTDDMLALANRFGGGRISALDCVRIIGAGLRGGGHDIADADVQRMRGDDGAAGFIDIVARLLAATFGGPVTAPIADVAIKAVEAAVVGMAKAEVGEVLSGILPLASVPPASIQALPPGPRPFHGPR